MNERNQRLKQVITRLVDQLAPSLPPSILVFRPFLTSGLNSIDNMTENQVEEILNYIKQSVQYIEGDYGGIKG